MHADLDPHRASFEELAETDLARYGERESAAPIHLVVASRDEPVDERAADRQPLQADHGQPRAEAHEEERSGDEASADDARQPRRAVFETGKTAANRHIRPATPKIVASVETAPAGGAGGLGSGRCSGSRSRELFVETIKPGAVRRPALPDGQPLMDRRPAVRP